MCEYIVDCMRNGDLKALKRIIRSMSNINDVVLVDEENSLNLLHLAAGIGCDHRDNILELLLELGADANYPGKQDKVKGVRALHIASSWGYDLSVKMLLLYHADASLRDSDGYSPIDYASVYDNYTCISILLKYGSLNTSSDTSCWSHVFETSAGESSTASFTFNRLNHSAYSPSRTPSSKPNLTQSLIDQVSRIDTFRETSCDYTTALEDETISPFDKSFIASSSDNSYPSSQSNQNTSNGSHGSDSRKPFFDYTNDNPNLESDQYLRSPSKDSHQIEIHGESVESTEDHTKVSTPTSFNPTLDLSDKSLHGSASSNDTNNTAIRHDETHYLSLYNHDDTESKHDDNECEHEFCQSATKDELPSNQEEFLTLSCESQSNVDNLSACDADLAKFTQNQLHLESTHELHNEHCSSAFNRELDDSTKDSITSIKSKQSYSGIGLNLDQYVSRESVDNNLEKLGDNYSKVLRAELKKFGHTPGPITVTTKGVYMKLLLSIQKTKDLANRPTLLNQKPEGYSYELKSLLSGKFPFSEAQDLEKEFIATSDSDMFHGPKYFFNYLLIDPRSSVSGIPSKCRTESAQSTLSFTQFIEAVFYIGKGQKQRDFAHLYDALADRDAITKAKIDQIRSIWSDGFGVISLHIFNNISGKEALTREALMIDAIGLNNLTNILKGTIKIRMNWNDHKRRLLGSLLLWKAFSIHLNEGRRQLKREDLSRRFER